MKQGKVICINNNKGGVLKTTTTTNLAGVLSDKGHLVLIIDADNQANASVSFGLNPDSFRTTLYDVLVDGLPAEDAIINAINNIDILPSNNSLISFEFDIIGNIQKYPQPYSIMKNALDHLRETYDYILIDTPPSLGIMNGNVFTFADEVLIPYAPELFSMRSLMEVVNVIRGFKEEYNPNLNILGVLRTLVNANTNIHTDIIQETNVYAYENDIYMFSVVIPNTIQFSNAITYYRTPATIAYSTFPRAKRRQFEKASLFYDLYDEILKRTERTVAP